MFDFLGELLARPGALPFLAGLVPGLLVAVATFLRELVLDGRRRKAADRQYQRDRRDGLNREFVDLLAAVVPSIEDICRKDSWYFHNLANMPVSEMKGKEDEDDWRDINGAADFEEAFDEVRSKLFGLRVKSPSKSVEKIVSFSSDRLQAYVLERYNSRIQAADPEDPRSAKAIFGPSSKVSQRREEFRGSLEAIVKVHRATFVGDIEDLDNLSINRRWSRKWIAKRMRESVERHRSERGERARAKDVTGEGDEPRPTVDLDRVEPSAGSLG